MSKKTPDEMMVGTGPDANPDIELASPMTFHATAKPIGNSVRENRFGKTPGNDFEPARKIDFHGSSANNRSAIASARYGNELERSEPRQIFRV